MKLECSPFPYNAPKIGYICLSQLTDCPDAVGKQFFLGFPANPEKVPDSQRPHLFPDFFRPQSMDLVRLLKVRCHLGQQLVGPDSHIDRKTKFGLDLVLEGSCNAYGILSEKAECHVQEAFVYGKLLKHGTVTAADGYETF